MANPLAGPKYNKAYVLAHCATRNFYHTGKGVWYEGLPPDGSDPRMGIKGPGAAAWKARNTNQTAEQIAQVTGTSAPSIAAPPAATPASINPPAAQPAPPSLVVVLRRVMLEAGIARLSAPSTAPAPSLPVRLPVTAPAPAAQPFSYFGAGLPSAAPPSPTTTLPPPTAPPTRPLSSRLAAKRAASPPPPPPPPTPPKRRQPAPKPRAASNNDEEAPPVRLDDNGRPYLANGPRDAVERHRRGLDMRGVDVSGGAAVVRGCPYSDLRGWRASSPRPWDETAKEMAARLAREEEDGEEEEGEGAGGAPCR